MGKMEENILEEIKRTNDLLLIINHKLELILEKLKF